MNSLVEEYRDGRNRSLLNSITFEHAAYLISNDVEKKLIRDLGVVLHKINSTKFPVLIKLGDTPDHFFTFIIEENDVDYVWNIYKSYKSLETCGYDKMIFNSNLDKSFQRFLYFLTEDLQRWPKCIHYYKNVRALFLHYATDTEIDTWGFTPSKSNGHMLPHFRNDDRIFFDGNFNGSIRKLNIDFEYLDFMVKKFTGYC